MRSQVVNVGSSSSSSAAAVPAHDSKRSVFERLGRQIDNSSLGPLTSGSKSSSNQTASLASEPVAGPSAQTASSSSSSIRKRLTDPLWESSSERRRQGGSMRSRYDPPNSGPMDTDNHNGSMDPPPPTPTLADGGKSSSNNRPLSPPLQAIKAPKYDRHGNLIVSLREKRRLMDHGRWPPSRPAWDSVDSRLGPRRSGGVDFYHPPGRDMEHRQGPPQPPPGYHSKAARDYPPGYGGHSRGSPPTHMPPHGVMDLHPGEEASRYARWRERRDTITSLDREAARLNSKTNSLKATRDTLSSHNLATNLKLFPLLDNNSTNSSAVAKPPPLPSRFDAPIEIESKNGNDGAAITSIESNSETVNTKQKKASQSKEPPEDMSDGEIVDDDDSDEIELMQTTTEKHQATTSVSHHRHDYYSKIGQAAAASSKYMQHKNSSGSRERPHDHDDLIDEVGFNVNSIGSRDKMIEESTSHRGEREPDYYANARRGESNYDNSNMFEPPPSKKKCITTNSLDHHQKANMADDNLETISDDEFDTMINDDQDSSTKDSSSNPYQENSNSMNKDYVEPQQTNCASPRTSADKDENELIKSLDIDWANLIDMAKIQSKSREVFTPDCARQRFTAFNYIKTLKISPELAGEELMKEINELFAMSEVEKSASSQPAEPLQEEIKEEDDPMDSSPTMPVLGDDDPQSKPNQLDQLKISNLSSELNLDRKMDVTVQ